MATESILTPCRECGTLNRYPTARPAGLARCGRCRAELFDGTPVELNEASFERFIEQNELPVVVDFWAPWCGPCQSMAPHFAAAAAELRGSVQLAKLDTEQAQNLAGRLGIRSIPTLVRFEAGRETERQSGAMSAEQIIAWCQSG